MSRRVQKAVSAKSRRRPERETPAAEVARLRAALAEAQAKLQQIEQEGSDRFLARRMAELEEGRQVARGQAVEATVARSRAEAQLQALRDAIGRAPGLSGWLLRRAQRRLG